MITTSVRSSHSQWIQPLLCCFHLPVGQYVSQWQAESIRKVSPSIIKTVKMTQSFMTSHNPVTLIAKIDPVTMFPSSSICIQLYSLSKGQKGKMVTTVPLNTFTLYFVLSSNKFSDTYLSKYFLIVQQNWDAQVF